MNTGGISCFFWLLVLFVLEAHAFEIIKKGNLKAGDVELIVDLTDEGDLEITLNKDDVSKLQGILGQGMDADNNTYVILSMHDDGNGFKIEWVSNDPTIEISDCFDLQKGEINWFGGPQIYEQDWPIEKLQLSGNDPYVVRKGGNFAGRGGSLVISLVGDIPDISVTVSITYLYVPERYWLNSNGAYIFVDDRVPLYIDQNMQTDGKVCFIAKNTGPYINRTKVIHTYNIVALDDAVSAHRHAVTNYLGRPTSLPNVNMIREPIWTTWAKFKKEITDVMVRDFAYDILNHGFKGQIEIDEQWETCFGSRIFMPDKFGNISNVVQDLKSKNLRVTLWAAPFVNLDCEDLINEGEEKGYFVKNTNGDMTTVWWESDDARQIDFTKPEAAEWYAEKLRKLLVDPGVDGFKFDAGETDYVAQPAVYDNEDPELVPNVFTQRYIQTVTQFNDLMEARSAYRTQNYSFLLRMIDKDSVWGLDDGFQSLITTLLQLNMVGYPFVLPDMIGGNGYRAQPDLELLIRWAQATVFMPSLQFSYLPWDFSNDEELQGTEIIRSMVALHEKYTDAILEAMTASITDGTPTNPPIWWIDPTDKVALQTYDEFLLGESILVAPVMEKGATSRTVYLPKGTWLDGNDQATLYSGPATITYDAPISVLPYFFIVKS